MNIEKIVVGPIQTNCFVLTSDKGNCVVIDPGEDCEEILQVLGLKPVKYIISTHGHFDHITVAQKLKEVTKAQFMINTLDSFMFPPNFVVDFDLKEGVIITCDDISFKVIHTPGHTPGSICLYDERYKVLFSGDTLFYADHGRCDLPGSSYDAMKNSLKKLFNLPQDIVVYPGHGPKTTIGDEKKRGLL